MVPGAHIMRLDRRTAPIPLAAAARKAIMFKEAERARWAALWWRGQWLAWTGISFGWRTDLHTSHYLSWRHIACFFPSRASTPEAAAAARGGFFGRSRHLNHLALCDVDGERASERDRRTAFCINTRPAQFVDFFRAALDARGSRTERLVIIGPRRSTERNIHAIILIYTRVDIRAP